ARSDSMVRRGARSGSERPRMAAACAKWRTRSPSREPSALPVAPRRAKEISRMPVAEPNRLEVAPERLLPFDRLEESLEVALPESAAPLSLDDLVEDRR